MTFKVACHILKQSRTMYFYKQAFLHIHSLFLRINLVESDNRNHCFLSINFFKCISNNFLQNFEVFALRMVLSVLTRLLRMAGRIFLAIKNKLQNIWHLQRF